MRISEITIAIEWNDIFQKHGKLSVPVVLQLNI